LRKSSSSSIPLLLRVNVLAMGSSELIFFERFKSMCRR